jgi:hypothetical protein
LLFFGTIAAVAVHAAIRIVVSIRRKEYDTDIIDYEKKTGIKE